MYQRFEVTPFIERPWQCFKCQQFGHSAKYCKNNDVCLICSGRHNLKDCHNKEDISKRKCANCGENHTSNYKGCRKIQEERQVQHIRAYQNLSYRDAAISVKNRKDISAQQIENPRNTVSMNPPNPQSKMKPLITKEASTQTNNEELTKEIQQKSEAAHAEKIALIFFETFNSLNKSDSIQKKCSTITTAVSTHYGISLNKNHLLNSFNQINNQVNASPIINTKTTHGIPKS